MGGGGGIEHPHLPEPGWGCRAKPAKKRTMVGGLGMRPGLSAMVSRSDAQAWGVACFSAQDTSPTQSNR